MSEAPPPKMARDMTPQERTAELAKLKRPKPERMPIDKTAKEMTQRERVEWLREHTRRFG